MGRGRRGEGEERKMMGEGRRERERERETAVAQPANRHSPRQPHHPLECGRTAAAEWTYAGLNNMF